MRVVGRDKLFKFCKKHADSRTALEAWLGEVSQEATIWQTTHDIKKRYQSADFLKDNRVIFNVKGNHYRLVVKVRFQNNLVFIEWIGTHSEYDKKTF